MGVLVASSTQTATGTAAITLSENVIARTRAAVFVLDVTAAATDGGDTLDVWLQHSVDGTSWDDFVRFTQVTGNGGAVQIQARWVRDVAPDVEQGAHNGKAIAAGVTQGPVGHQWRAAWTIADAGTDNASFTFSISANLSN
jgi:hypothetical protein